ncbi:hypothetical protein LIER_33964 [Lithospermum erythrorhizon]|uniref:Plastocyanin-like domain-containing protein n=1 Tax=Lithospermum erythrorhizon TaxID=34254 RepID=A0AAV3S2X8_LITER
MTVVSIDACYTNPYTIDTITIAPGQTMDVLLKADQPLGSYYMAASVYQGSDFVTLDDTTPCFAYSNYTSCQDFSLQGNDRNRRRMA